MTTAKNPFVSIGFGNVVSISRLIAIVGPESSPIRRLIQEARDQGNLIDATSGRKTQSVLIMDSDHLILSALSPVDIEKVWQEGT